MSCEAGVHDFGPAPIADDARCVDCDLPVMTGAILPLDEWSNPSPTVQSLNEPEGNT